MRVLKWAAICAGLSVLPQLAQADTIVLMADEWCPYNCDPNSDSPGFMVEIAREALEPYGHVVEYQTLNCARPASRPDW